MDRARIDHQGSTSNCESQSEVLDSAKHQHKQKNTRKYIPVKLYRINYSAIHGLDS